MNTEQQSRMLEKNSNTGDAGPHSLLDNHSYTVVNTWEKKSVKLKTGTIEYLEKGINNNVHLLLLHGLGGSAERWIETIPFLCKKYHVIAPDMIGFGHSDKPEVDYYPEFFVKFVFDLLDALGIEKINIVGSSLGGQIAAGCAVTRDPRVDSIVLVSPSGTLKEITPAMSTFFAAALYPNHHLVRNAYQMMLNPCQNRVVDLQYVERFIETISQPNALLAFMSTILCFKNSPSITEELTKIIAPTLLIWGRHDMVIPIDCARDFVASIKDCKFEVMEKCGHVPHVEEPEKFSNMIIDFLTQKLDKSRKCSIANQKNSS
ncbi:MAG: alpha/beta fold hydrolase [Nitrosotalea sp.]